MNANLNASSAAVDIDALDVSDQWKTYFKGVRKYGGLNAWKGLKAMPLEERKVAMREMRPPLVSLFLACLFGFFYYVAKGMWKKGLVLLAMVWAFIFVLSFVLFLILGPRAGHIGIYLNFFFGWMAMRDYYAFKVDGDDGWLPVKPF